MNAGETRLDFIYPECFLGNQGATIFNRHLSIHLVIEVPFSMREKVRMRAIRAGMNGLKRQTNSQSSSMNMQAGSFCHAFSADPHPALSLRERKILRA